MRLSKYSRDRIVRAADRRRAVRIPVRLRIDAVVEIRNVVVRDDVSGAVHLDRDVRSHHRRELLSVFAVELPPELARPADDVIGIVPSDEVVVGNVEVARSRVVREDAGADVLEPAAFHRDAFGARNELRAGENRVVGVPERQSLEVRVVRGADVEQREVARAVENRRTVACAFDDDRLLGCALREQVVRPVERCRAIHGRIVRIFVAVVLVDTGMHEDGVAGLHARTAGRRPVGAGAGEVVRAHQAFERRLDLRAFIAWRIHVVDVAARRRHRLGTRSHRDGLRGLAAHAVGIAKDESRFVGRIRFEIENAAGEHVRRDDVELIALPDALALQPQQRQRLLPVGRALLPIRHVNRRVPVVVALDEPLEAEVDQRGWIDEKLACRDRTAGRSSGHHAMPEADTNHDREHERE